MQKGGGGDWTAGSVAHSLWCNAALGELPLAGLQFETLNDKASAKRVGRTESSPSGLDTVRVKILRALC